MTTHARGSGDLWRTAAWTVAALVALDLGLGAAFRMPSDARTPPSTLAQYFDYGRSLESKLRRMAGPADSLANPMAPVGWLDARSWPAPEPLAAGHRRVTVLGQSFTFAVADSLAPLEPTWAIRRLGAMAAPASHLVALWTLDRTRVHSDVVVLGVLASSVRGMDAASGSTWTFESPYAYTYPRWRPSGDSLSAAWPSVRSLAGLRATLADPQALRAWRRELAQQDAWYSPSLAHAGAADVSVFGRLLRRAWAQRHLRERTARVHGPRGFVESAEGVVVLRRMVERFAAGVRADGGVPVVLLLHDRGYDDHLARALAGALEHGRVPVVSSHRLVSAADPRSFVADGHYVAAANGRIARAVAEAVAAEDARRSFLTERAAPGAGAWSDPAAVAEAFRRWPLAPNWP